MKYIDILNQLKKYSNEELEQEVIIVDNLNLTEYQISNFKKTKNNSYIFKDTFQQNFIEEVSDEEAEDYQCELTYPKNTIIIELEEKYN